MRNNHHTTSIDEVKKLFNIRHNKGKLLQLSRTRSQYNRKIK